MDPPEEIPEDSPERGLSDLARRMGSEVANADPSERSRVRDQALRRLVEASSLRADWLRPAREWLEFESDASGDPGAREGVAILRTVEALADPSGGAR